MDSTPLRLISKPQQKLIADRAVARLLFDDAKDTITKILSLIEEYEDIAERLRKLGYGCIRPGTKLSLGEADEYFSDLSLSTGHSDIYDAEDYIGPIQAAGKGRD